MNIRSMFRSRFAKAALVVAGLTGVSFAAPKIAEATGWSESQVAAQLLVLASGMNLYNAELTDVQINDLTNGYYHTISLNNLQAGQTYVFMGVCDNDCSDMDMSLYDDAGNMVDRDVAPDAYPIVDVNPRWTGDFSLRVSMPDCQANYCSYGVGMFE